MEANEKAALSFVALERPEEFSISSKLAERPNGFVAKIEIEMQGAMR